MALHRLTTITLGVPDVDPVARYYEEFGLTPVGDGRFATVDGGEQLRLVTAPTRRLLELGIGAADTDDLGRIGRSLAALDVAAEVAGDMLIAHDPATRVRVVVRVAERMQQRPAVASAYNAPGRLDRKNARADGIVREARVHPRKLGHVVLGSTDFAASQRFFIEGLGFKVSDTIDGLASFLRCSTDHHNLLVQPAPVPFVHHTSWQVDDVDEVGRGAHAMLAADPGRHVWGLGRHHIGSNFFWYLKDPAGNFSEYYADLECILDDQLWKPEVWERAKGLFNWGPAPPRSFISPDDLAELMAGAHG